MNFDLLNLFVFILENSCVQKVFATVGFLEQNYISDFSINETESIIQYYFLTRTQKLNSIVDKIVYDENDPTLVRQTTFGLQSGENGF